MMSSAHRTISSTSSTSVRLRQTHPAGLAVGEGGVIPSEIIILNLIEYCYAAR